MGHFGNLIAKFLNVLFGFFREPHFLQGLDKRVNGRIFEPLMFWGDDSEDLGTVVVMLEVFFGGLP